MSAEPRIGANVGRWLVAYMMSAIGDNAYFLALGLTASQLGDPSQIGLVLGVGAVPRAVLMLGGGVVADRFGARPVVLASDAVRFLVIATLASLLVVTTPEIWLLVVVALIFGVVDAMFLPAVGALPQAITVPGTIARVQSLRALVVRIGNTAGPPLGGLLVGLGGPPTAFAVIGAMFGLSLITLLFVRPAARRVDPAPAHQNMRRQLVEGLRYVRRHQVVSVLVVVLVFVEIGSVAPLGVGLLLLAKENGWGSTGAGWMLGAFGAGSGASALLLAVAGTVPREGLTYVTSLLVGGITLGGFPFAPGLGFGIVLAVLAGLSLGLNGALAYAFVQHEVDPRFMGRVMAVLSLVSFGMGPIGYPLFGLMATAVGVRAAYLCFTASLLIAVVVAATSSSIRRATLATTQR